MKLWEKGIEVKDSIIRFTSGDDRFTDLPLAPFDIIGTMAHVIMLESINTISREERISLLNTLTEIYYTTKEQIFIIEEGVEDVHSQLEKMLTEKLGDAGKKVHTARSRNDQVITCIKLYLREELVSIFNKVETLANILFEKSEANKDLLFPGYTHTQAAMPSSAGLWFAAYAESLIEDLYILEGAFRYTNQSPLGSAAGYGSGFPINREITSELLEFENLHINSINAQMSRGKTERYVVMAVGGIAHTLSKLADDMCWFLCENFDFISMSEDLTTGSSIMPHKKNPDVLELIRAKCNAIQGMQTEIMFITSNLTSGYHRDFQLLKQISFNAINELKNCLDIMCLVLTGVKVKDNIMQRGIYRYLWSVDSVNEKVQKGVPFREAYIQVAQEIQEDHFRPGDFSKHIHTGSIGNLSNEKIKEKLKTIIIKTEVRKYTDFRERFISKIIKENATQK